jgi:hypothetical protein
MMNDDHSASDQRGLSERLQTAWARVLDDVLVRRAHPPGPGERDSSRADTFRRDTASLPERLARRSPMGELPKKLFRSVAMPSMAGLAWRDQILFGFTGASILVALITIAIVLSHMLARGTP